MEQGNWAEPRVVLYSENSHSIMAPREKYVDVENRESLNSSLANSSAMKSKN